jgi:hypothetical protein
MSHGKHYNMFPGVVTIELHIRTLRGMAPGADGCTAKKRLCIHSPTNCYTSNLASPNKRKWVSLESTCITESVPVPALRASC